MIKASKKQQADSDLYDLLMDWLAEKWPLPHGEKWTYVFCWKDAYGVSHIKGQKIACGANFHYGTDRVQIACDWRRRRKKLMIDGKDYTDPGANPIQVCVAMLHETGHALQQYLGFGASAPAEGDDMLDHLCEKGAEAFAQRQLARFMMDRYDQIVPILARIQV